MAQDFYAATGLGKDDLHISTLDSEGVALAAIRGLCQAALEKHAQITAVGVRLEAAGALESYGVGLIPCFPQLPLFVDHQGGVREYVGNLSH